ASPKTKPSGVNALSAPVSTPAQVAREVKDLACVVKLNQRGQLPEKGRVNVSCRTFTIRSDAGNAHDGNAHGF
ncbi:MAG: hypothetical protein AAGA36_10575, partial [Pseudomonadota bacterium]